MIICPVKIQNHDNLSKLVCIECLEVVTSAYQLREVSSNNDRKYRDGFLNQPRESNDNDDLEYEEDEEDALFELKMECTTNEQIINYEPAPNTVMPTTELLTMNKDCSVIKLLLEKPTTSNASLNASKTDKPKQKERKKKKPFMCVWCKRQFISIQGLQTHLRNFHINFDKMFDLKRFAIKKDYSCDLCGNSFFYKSGIQNHVLVDHLIQKNRFKRPVKCDEPECFVFFKSYNEMERHKLRIHRNSSSQSIQCSNCSLGFRSVVKLFAHKITHHQELLKIEVLANPEYKITKPFGRFNI
ncbi:unnamed protein product [Diamesa serratosioi]